MYCHNFRSSTGGRSDGVSSPVGDKVDPEYQFIRLEDMEIVATLGMGGFGRVELVSKFVPHLPDLVYGCNSEDCVGAKISSF